VESAGEGVVYVRMSISKRKVNKIGRVRRWEERSAESNLELTGRR
jgi:hypothetical protein